MKPDLPSFVVAMGTILSDCDVLDISGTMDYAVIRINEGASDCIVPDVPGTMNQAILSRTD